MRGILRSSNMQKDGPSGSDLAWIIHGVVIAQGFFYLSKSLAVHDFCSVVCILLTLLVGIVDWHIFYTYFYQVKYDIFMWVLDYFILGVLALTFEFASHKDNKCYFLILFFILIVLILCSYGIMYSDRKDNFKK